MHDIWFEHNKRIKEISRLHRTFSAQTLKPEYRPVFYQTFRGQWGLKWKILNSDIFSGNIKSEIYPNY